MMRKYYSFAGIELAVELAAERMYTDDLQLAAFRKERVANPHCYQVTVVPGVKPPVTEELATLPGSRVFAAGDGYVRYIGAVAEDPINADIRAEHRGSSHRIEIAERLAPGYVSARLVLNALDVENLVASSGGVILHASYIGWEGKAIVFTASSGTGKTTQAELWRKHRGAEIVNGDRAVIIPHGGCICAGGLPFSGSSHYCSDRTLPLAAVVYLKQAPQTSIRRLRGVEAFRRIWEGCCINNWNRTDVSRTTELVGTILARIPVYELACTPDESAVVALERLLRKEPSI